jgi:hypothetical protein
MNYDKIKKLVEAAQPMTIMEDKLVVEKVLDSNCTCILTKKRSNAIEKFIKMIGRQSLHWEGDRDWGGSYVYFDPPLTEEEADNELPKWGIELSDYREVC